MDIFSTNSLNRLVSSLNRPQTALLTAYFPEIETSDTETISFDVENTKRRIAPFVSPLREGRLVEDLGYKTNTFTPAYIKDKRVFDPNKALKRAAGETIGGDRSPADRLQANLVRATADQVEMLMRRKEVMASEVLRTGKVTISGDGYPTTVVDFGRSASHTVALTTTARWGETGVSPLASIKAWGMTVLKSSGAKVQDVIFDVLAAELFLADPAVKEFLNTRPLNVNTDNVTSVNFAELGLSYVGSIGGYRFWIYSDWYVDENNTEQPIIPDYTVMMVSDDLDGVQHHGAIRDVKAGLPSMEYFVKSWEVEDPSRRILLMQSAPLIVPYRPDATFAATVR